MVETGGAEIFVEQNVLRVRGVTITRVLAVLELCILVEAGESGGEDLAESRGDAKAEQHRHRPRGAAGQRGGGRGRGLLPAPPDQTYDNPRSCIGLVGQPSQVRPSAYHLLKLITNPCMRLRRRRLPRTRRKREASRSTGERPIRSQENLSTTPPDPLTRTPADSGSVC